MTSATSPRPFLLHQFKIFVCSYVVSGQLLNLELTFPEKPLLSEIRARTVNAFRAEEAAIIDRSQSIAFDVALLFIYDGGLQRWRPMQSAGSGGDIVEGCQIYAQPRISSSVIRSICDNSDAIEMQRIPSPIKGRLAQHQQQNLAQQQQEIMAKQQQEFMLLQQQQMPHQLQKDQVQAERFSKNYLGAVPASSSSQHQSPQQRHREQQVLLSSDDDEDDGDRTHHSSSRRQRLQAKNNYNGTDLALAESWDEACRTLFRYLDDDRDGLVDIGEIPDTLERIATQSTATSTPSNRKSIIPESFSSNLSPSSGRRQQQGRFSININTNDGASSSLVDETSFIAFCCKHENTGIVSGLLAFIHSCNKARQDVEHHQKLLDRIHKGLFPNRRAIHNNNFSPNHQQQQQQQQQQVPYYNTNYDVNIVHSPQRPPEFLQQQSLMYASPSSATPLQWMPNQQQQYYQNHQMMMIPTQQQPQQQVMMMAPSSPFPQQQQQQQFRGFYGQYANNYDQNQSVAGLNNMSPVYPQNMYRNVGFQ